MKKEIWKCNNQKCNSEAVKGNTSGWIQIYQSDPPPIKIYHKKDDCFELGERYDDLHFCNLDCFISFIKDNMQLWV